MFEKLYMCRKMANMGCKCNDFHTSNRDGVTKISHFRVFELKEHISTNKDCLKDHVTIYKDDCEVENDDEVLNCTNNIKYRINKTRFIKSANKNVC